MWEKLAEALIKNVLDNPELLERIVLIVFDIIEKQNTEKVKVEAAAARPKIAGHVERTPSAW